MSKFKDDMGALKIMMNKHIKEKLKCQQLVFQTQLKNAKTFAMEEASNFMSNQTDAISKHITKEHHRILERFMAFKDRTDERLQHADKLELEICELEKIRAIEAPTKEALYALDETNPLSLYDCLIPELTAYRPLRRPMSDEQTRANFAARQKLKEAEYKIVSLNQKIFVLCSD